MPLKLLHIADVHLDAPFGWLGRRGAEQRRQLVATFRSAINLAIEENVDAVLIAGDLFDSNSPAQSSIDFVREQLRRLARPSFILPGTHDRLDSGSIFRRVPFGEDRNVHVFKPENLVFHVEPIGLAVHASANETRTCSESPLRGLQPLPSAVYNVALAHGSLAMPTTMNDYPIGEPDIAASGFDYLALGHWHKSQDCSKGDTTAWYSGPLEILNPDDDGAALIVEIADHATPGARRARVTRHVLGRTKCRRISVAVDTTSTASSVREAIVCHSDTALVLRVTLTGVRPLGEPLDTDGLFAELAERFYDLRIEDQTHPAFDDDALAALDERLVIGKFARLMLQRIADASDEAARRRSENALQLGVARLQNRKVL